MVNPIGALKQPENAPTRHGETAASLTPSALLTPSRSEGTVAAHHPVGVQLPGGVVLDDGRCLAEAELRALTGREEDWLAGHPTAPSAVTTTYLLNACLVGLGDVIPNLALVRRMLVGDRDYLMLQLRRLTLGEQISAVMMCPACRARMDVDFLIADVPVDCRPMSDSSYLVDRLGANQRERPVRFRLPNGADQEAVLGLELDRAADTILDRCLLDDGGTPLTADERTILADEMERLAPGITLELDLRCPECGHDFVAPFDTTAFFLEEMRIEARRLLKEVHLLAFSYHWSEADILSLPRGRRRAYLALLSDASRRD